MSDPGPPPIPGSPPTPSTVPVPGPAKKGLSPLAWVGIGCGGVVVLGLVALVVLGVSVFNWGRDALEEATGEQSLSDIIDNLEDDPAKTLAEAAIRLNPEFEQVNTDDDAGTITFRNTETGERV